MDRVGDDLSEPQQLVGVNPAILSNLIWKMLTILVFVMPSGNEGCRYASVKTIRNLLDKPDPDLPPNHDSSSERSARDYLEISITTSWIGGGSDGRRAILGFFHATKGEFHSSASMKSHG